MSRVPDAWLPFATAEETELPGKDRTSSFTVIEESRFENPDAMPDDVAALLNASDADADEDKRIEQERLDREQAEKEARW